MSKLKIKIVNENAHQYYKPKDSTLENAGFDLFTLEDILVNQNDTFFIDLGIQCEMISKENKNIAYYLYPRSSLSKTPLIMANSVGIIDKGYRGNLKAPIKNINNEPYFIKKGTRLFQICDPSLDSFETMVVDCLTESDRGEKGFGSSGI